MLPEFARGNLLWELAFSGLILGIAIVIALLIHPLLTRVVVQGLVKRTQTTLDDALVQAVGLPLFAFVMVQGLFLALTTTTLLDQWQEWVQRLWLASVMAVVFYGLQRVTGALLRWYGEEVATRTRGRLDEMLLPLVRRFLTVIIYGLGALLILDNLGIEISPLLAGLGLGGLAVALALQPSLSNFIAGAFVVADGSIGVGDFIEIQGGPRGYVMDIGWRSTRIRTPFNNLVVVPNSRLADSIFTNYSNPSMAMGIMVEAGVSYSSNLARVREVALEEATRLIEEMPEVDKTVQPWFGYERFGESNVDFWVWLQAKDRISSFAIKTELMIRLHERFAQEGIEINYPVRKLVYPLPDGARTPPQS